MFTKIKSTTTESITIARNTQNTNILIHLQLNKNRTHTQKLLKKTQYNQIYLSTLQEHNMIINNDNNNITNGPKQGFQGHILIKDK